MLRPGQKIGRKRLPFETPETARILSVLITKSTTRIAKIAYPMIVATL
jgi:hypothetical protein